MVLQVFSEENVRELINVRSGEIKLGECVETITNSKNVIEELQSSKAKFVIIGVLEDIGVRMNYGNGGAHTAFIPALKAFLNTQQNQFNRGENVLVLGYLDFLDDVVNFNSANRTEGDELVKKVDDELSKWIEVIVGANKIPIVIGGGHNNAYGNIKGTSLAKNEKINVINLDAHTDLRFLEERHSGNGFSYALQHNFLHRYFMFGLHQNYTPQYIFEQIHNDFNLEYNFFEEMEVFKTTSFDRELERATNFIADNSFGIEIDLDCIQNFPSSAMTPSGFTPQQARYFVYQLGKNENAAYLHICEGAPIIVENSTASAQVGKFISYLITDFIKSSSL